MNRYLLPLAAVILLIGFLVIGLKKGDPRDVAVAVYRQAGAGIRATDTGGPGGDCRVGRPCR